MVFLWLFLGAFFTIILLIAFFVIQSVHHPKVQTYESAQTIEFNAKTYTRDYLDSLQYESFSIMSDYGYELKGLYIPNQDHPHDKIIFLSHGYECTLYRSIKYVSIFIKLGFSIAVFDHRYHGESGGSFCSFGYYEKHDMRRIIDYIKRQYGHANTVFGSHGSSMGAAIALQHAAIDNRISFVISESSFCSFKTQMKEQLIKRFFVLAYPILWLASFLNKIKHGFFFNEVAPLKA
jgi:pimeloyl-ACP methyl ester carboxylesterase